MMKIDEDYHLAKINEAYELATRKLIKVYNNEFNTYYRKYLKECYLEDE